MPCIKKALVPDLQTSCLEPVWQIGHHPQASHLSILVSSCFVGSSVGNSKIHSGLLCVSESFEARSGIPRSPRKRACSVYGSGRRQAKSVEVVLVLLSICILLFLSRVWLHLHPFPRFLIFYLCGFQFFALRFACHCCGTETRMLS